MIAEAHARSQCRVVVERLQSLPLFAQIDANVCSGHGQISAALIKAEILDFVAFVQLDGFEIL